MATIQSKIDRLRELHADANDEDAAEILDMIEQLTAKQTESPFLVGVGSGMTRVGQDIYGLGVGAGEVMGIGDEGAFADYRDEVHRERELMDPLKEEYTSASVGEVVGEVAGTLPFGGVTGATAKQIPNFTGRMAANMGIGAGQGALGADDPAEGALWGAGGSVVGETVGEMARLLGKGEMPNIPHLMEDVRPMRADDAGTIYGTLERAAETLPVGRNAIVTARQKQQEQLQGSVGKLIDKYDEGFATSEISESLTRRMGERKGEAGRLYDDLSEQVGGDIVGPQWKGEIADIADKLKAAPEELQDQAMITRLEDYIRGNEDLTWDQLRELRSLMSRDISDTYKGGSLVGSTDTPSLMQAKTAVTGALDETAQAADAPLWREADKFYREEVAGPYKDSPSIVKDIMSVQSSEQVVDKLLGVNVAKNPTLVTEVMNGLDEAGRSQVAVEIMRKAFEENVEGIISPANAATFISRRKELFKQVIPNENWDEIVSYLRHIKGAGQYGGAPVRTGFGAEQVRGLMPGSVLGGGALIAGADPLTAGVVVGGSIVLPVLLGKITAALATGEPGAVGKLIAATANAVEPAGRLAGARLPTDE